MTKEVFENVCTVHQAELVALDTSATAIAETLMRLSASASSDTRVIDAISLLEKTLEEEVVVIPGRGARSNLMEFRALLETVQKLRFEVTKLSAAGIARENLLASPGLVAYRIYNGFEAFALQLFDALQPAPRNPQ